MNNLFFFGGGGVGFSHSCNFIQILSKAKSPLTSDHHLGLVHCIPPSIHSCMACMYSSHNMIPSLTPSFFFLFFFFFFFFNPSFQSQVSISLTTTTLPKSGKAVLIRWSGIDSPSELDWLGIYSPHDHFIGFIFLSKSPTWRSGSGSISIPLINLRSNYSFRWTPSEIDPNRQDHDNNPLPGTHHLLGFSQELAFLQGRGPEQIHLAFTDNEDEMRVMFVTPNSIETYVRYGETEDELDAWRWHLSAGTRGSTCAILRPTKALVGGTLGIYTMGDGEFEARSEVLL